MIALVVLVLAAQPAPEAATATELLAHGEQLLEDLEYSFAAEELMRAATAPDATPEQRLRAHLLAGTANRIAGHDVDAQMSFRYVLTNAPDTKLPEGTPPKVATFFEAVRQEVQAEKRSAPQPAPAPAPPAPAPSGGAPIGLVVAGGGAAVGLVGAAGLIGAEVFLTNPTADGRTRGAVQTMGVAAAAALGVGVVTLAVGAVTFAGS